MKIAIHDKKHKFIKLESLINIRENKKMKQKRRWKERRTRLSMIVFVILILGLSFVYGSQVATSFLNKDISKIELKKQKNINVSDFHPIKVYDYLDKSSNSKFKIQIIEFGSEDELDSWMRSKIEKSFKKEMLNENIFFIDQYKNYAFWKSGNTNFIQIISIKYDKLTKDTINDNFKEEGSGIFPEELIEEYLSQYPSYCSEEGCLSNDKKVDKKIREDLKWFNNPPKNIKKSNDYFGDDSCPINENGWKKLEDSPSLDESELQELKERCVIYGGYKDSEGLSLSSSLKICGEEIDFYLNENDIYIYDGEETLDECFLRESFLNEHPEYTQEERELLSEKRNEFFLREVRFLEELEEKMNSKSFNDKIDKSIEEKYEKRNIAHNLNKEPKSEKEKNTNNINKRSEGVVYWFEK